MQQQFVSKLFKWKRQMCRRIREFCLREYFPDHPDAFRVKIQVQVETEEEQGDVEKYLAALLIEGNVFQGIQREGAKLVYDFGRMRSRAVILGRTRGVESPVIDVEDVIRAI